MQILERSYDRCLELAAQLPNTSVIHADSSNPDNLDDHNISDCDALVTLQGSVTVPVTITCDIEDIGIVGSYQMAVSLKNK